MDYDLITVRGQLFRKLFNGVLSMSSPPSSQVVKRISKLCLPLSMLLSNIRRQVEREKLKLILEDGIAPEMLDQALVLEIRERRTRNTNIVRMLLDHNASCN